VYIEDRNKEFLYYFRMDQRERKRRRNMGKYMYIYIKSDPKRDGSFSKKLGPNTDENTSGQVVYRNKTETER
jgi:hypothetical protein